MPDELTNWHPSMGTEPEEEVTVTEFREGCGCTGKLPVHTAQLRREVREVEVTPVEGVRRDKDCDGSGLPLA